MTTSCEVKVGKKVAVKNKKVPKLKMRNLTVNYVQVAYDNRYIIVNNNPWGNFNEVIMKMADKDMAKVVLESLMATYDSKGKENLDKFWQDVSNYDVLLDAECEAEII